jgi:hypothetical protein
MELAPKLDPPLDENGRILLEAWLCPPPCSRWHRPGECDQCSCGTWSPFSTFDPRG